MAGSTPSGALVGALRVVGAALLVATAIIHGHLWRQGYAGIDVVGPAFLANAVLGALGGLLLLAAPDRWLPWVAAAGAALSAGTLGGLLLSTTVGLFGFVESTAASLWWESFWVDVAGTVVLAALVPASRARGELAEARRTSGVTPPHRRTRPVGR